MNPDIKLIIEIINWRLDTNTTRKQDGSLKTTEYRKATHTDHYLDFNSAHPTDLKLGVVRTLHQRAEIVIYDDNEFKSGIDHVNIVLKRCDHLG